MRLQRFYSCCSPSFEPLTHRPFTHSQCDCNVFLLPALLFELPGSHPPFFSPIGFLWCSHTLYGITLYFLLPRSVAMLELIALDCNQFQHCHYFRFPTSP